MEVVEVLGRKILELKIKKGARLPKEEVRALAGDVLQVGGVSLTRGGRPLAISPEELREPEKAQEGMIFPQEAVLALEAGGVAFDLLGLDSLTRRLREVVEEKGVFDFSRRRSERVPVAEDFSSTSLPSAESLISSFAEVEAKAGLILRVADSLLKDPRRGLFVFGRKRKELAELKVLRRRVKTWQKIVGQWQDNLFGFSEEELADYQKIIENQKGRLSTPQGERKSYEERLEDLLADPKKRQRYANIFWREKNAPYKAREAANLFLETALAVNTARVLHRLHDPEGKKGGPLDLLAAREKAADLRRKAEEIRENPSLSQEEKQRELEKLNKELIDLLIPIANKVAALFPHNTAYSLSAILAKEETVCVGMTEVLKAVCRWLGLEGKGVSVLVTLENTSSHTCLEVDSFTQTKIIIDGNYLSHHYLMSWSDEDIVRYVDQLITKRKIPASEREKVIAAFKRYRANSSHIPPSSEVLIYTLTPTGKKAEKDYRCKKFEAIRLCPYPGEREIWQASIPFPHLLIAPDRPREITSSGYHDSLGVLYAHQGKREEAEQQFLEALRINPNHALAHYNLGSLYHDQGKREEAEQQYLEALRINPNHANVHNNLGCLYDDQGKLEEAVKHFREFVRILEEKGLTEDPQFVNFYQRAKEFLSKKFSFLNNN